MAAYGRLDVYRPDQPIEAYELDKPTIGIGRQPGNDIVIDTAGVSRYHFVIELRGDTAYLIDKDSQNGTYIDGVKVTSDQPHALREGEEIQAGDARIVFHSNAQSDIPTSEQTPVKTSEPTFHLEMDDSELSVTPGAHTQALIKIENIGTEPDTYELHIEGMPKEWTRLDRIEMDVPPGASAQAVLSIKPIRRSDSKPGLYNVKAVLNSKEHPESRVEFPIHLNVLSYGGFGMVLGTPRVSEGTPFELYIQNQGSGQLPLSFIGRDPGSRYLFDIQPPSVTLNAGEKKTIRGTIQPKQKSVFGPTGNFPFDVIAQSRDAARFQVAVRGYFVERRRFPAWLPLVGLLGVGVALLALILIVGLLVVPALTPKPTATATTTITPVPATITPIQVIIPSFTPPASETLSPTASPTPGTPTEDPGGTQTQQAFSAQLAATMTAATPVDVGATQTVQALATNIIATVTGAAQSQPTPTAPPG